MNPDTRVSVHCYEGDAHQVRDALHLHTHHQVPVTIISPRDSQVVIDAPGVECVHAGFREGSIETRVMGGLKRTVTCGPVANERQIQQMARLLMYPENFFFMNDADSMCLSPELPDYLYAEPDILWCNLAHDALRENQIGYESGFPRLAFQPPYFFSRRTMQAMIEASPRVKYNALIPWIDHFLVQCAVEAKLVWKGFPDCAAGGFDSFRGNLEWAQIEVRHKGKIMIHSSKSAESWGPLVLARQQFLADYRGPNDHRPNPDTFTTRDVHPPGSERFRTPKPPRHERDLGDLA